MSEGLSKVDSAVQGLEHTAPAKNKKAGKDAKAAKDTKDKKAEVVEIKTVDELRDSKTPIEVSKDANRTGWKINASPNSVDEPAILKKPLTNPGVKKIELITPTGIALVARGKPVSIKDALDAIYKQYKKKPDDEIDEPYLTGFVWWGDRQGQTEEETKEEWTRLHVVLSNTQGATNFGGSSSKKSKKNKSDE